MRFPKITTAAHVGVKLLMFGRRRQDLTPAEYRDYYENHHMPLLRNLTGDAFPLSHKRTYVVRNPPDFDAEVVIGEQEDFPYDSMTLLTWRDQAHFEALFVLYGDDDVGKQIAEDESHFVEWGKAVLVN